MRFQSRRVGVSPRKIIFKIIFYVLEYFSSLRVFLLETTCVYAYISQIIHVCNLIFIVLYIYMSFDNSSSSCLHKDINLYVFMQVIKLRREPLRGEP